MKIVFLDADGTLFHHSGYIPSSALDACNHAQKNGHKICLCTGRQKVEIFGDLTKIDYDGIIAGSGASIFVHGKQIVEKTFDEFEFNTVYNFLNDHQIPALYESSVGIFATQKTKDRLKELLEIQCGHLDDEQRKMHGLYTLYHQVHVVNDLHEHPINKISFLESRTPYQKVYEDLSPVLDVIPATFAPLGKESGEISSKRITKATGMEVLIDYYKMDDKDTIAIGDGHNDLCMFEKAAISVAMGNASIQVKEKADLITTSITDNGIYNAFKDLALI